MARGIQLSEVREKLRAEVGHSVKLSVNTDNLPRINQIIRRTQETLYDDYEWPFLRILPTKSLSAGQRYYDLPSDLNLERVEKVAVWYNGLPHPIDRGISWSEYAAFDSDNDERSDPVLKWDVRNTGSGEQIEVWPIPASNDMKLQFEGVKKLGGLVNDSDTLDLDDNLVVLFAAAEILSNQQDADAEVKLRAAQNRLQKLRAQHSAGRPTVAMGQGDGHRKPLIGRTIVRVS